MAVYKDEAFTKTTNDSNNSKGFYLVCSVILSVILLVNRCLPSTNVRLVTVHEICKLEITIFVF